MCLFTVLFVEHRTVCVVAVSRLAEERRGIGAAGDELGDGLDDAGFVVFVGDAEPGGVGGEHRDGGLAVFDHVVNEERDVPFGFGVVDVVVEPLGEAGLHGVEELGGEAPEVHGDAFVTGEGDGVGGVFEVVDALLCAFDAGHLDNVLEGALPVCLGDAAGDVAVFGEGLVEAVADHGEAPFLAFAEEVGDALEGVGAVEVVGIDGAEWAFDEVARGADGVGGAEGFGAVGGADVGGREVGAVLECELDVRPALVFAGDVVAEDLFEVFADDEDDVGEAGLEGVVDGVVHEGFAVGADGFDLFESAEAAAHACGEYDECEVHSVVCFRSCVGVGRPALARLLLSYASAMSRTIMRAKPPMAPTVA